MMHLFKSIPLQVLLRSNAVEIIRLDTGQRVQRTTRVHFSSERLVIANFEAAEKFLREVLRELIPPKRFFHPRLHIVIQQLELLEGGLSLVEVRALRDLCEHCGALRVIVIDHGTPLTTHLALQKLNHR